LNLLHFTLNFREFFMTTRKSSSTLASVSLLALLALSGCASSGSMFGSKSTNPAYDSAMMTAAESQKKGDLQNAASFYGKAAQSAPNDVTPLIALGDVLWQMKNASESARVLEAARKLTPHNDEVLRGLGRAYVGLNEPQKAQEAYLSALEVDPNNARTLSGLGIAYDLEGDHATAQSHYRSGLALAPNDGDLKNNLAYSLISAKDYAGAAEVLEPLLRAGTATKRHRMNLALAYGLLGRDDEARSVASADLTPAAIERNLKVYRQLRNEPEHSKTMASIGKPGYVPELAKPKAAPAPKAAEPAVVADIPPPPSPSENEVVLGQASSPADVVPMPEPTEPARVVVAPPAEAPAPAMASDAAMPMASASVPQAAAAPPAPVATPYVAAETPVTAPATELVSPKSSSLETGKIYLGKYDSEASAREAWIRVWTNNSTTLSNLVASIEPNGTDVALFAVGAGSAQKADDVCNALRQTGVSCGVTN
jgi:Flp pilus assembly protein TadD